MMTDPTLASLIPVAVCAMTCHLAVDIAVDIAGGR